VSRKALVIPSILVACAAAMIWDFLLRPLSWAQVGPSAVGAFLGSSVGVLGALLVFLLGYRQTRAREAQEREREGVTLLRLVWMELTEHSATLDKYAADLSLVWAHPLPPSAEIWNESKARITYLVGGDLLVDLFAYYSHIRTLDTWRAGPPLPREKKVADLVEVLRQRNEQLRAGIRPIIITDPS
jgi:hypothetical protein